MGANITIRIGNKAYAVASGQIPPVGTRIAADKFFSVDGTPPILEVLGHEWSLREHPEGNGDPEFHVTIQAKIVG